MQFRPEVVRDAAPICCACGDRGGSGPVVGAAFPLEQAGEAHRSIEERRSTGKVVLVP